MKNKISIELTPLSMIAILNWIKADFTPEMRLSQRNNPFYQTLYAALVEFETQVNIKNDDEDLMEAARKYLKIKSYETRH